MTKPIKILLSSAAFLLLFSLSAFSQNQVVGFEYGYDASGNRTSRTIILGDDDQLKNSADSTQIDRNLLADREITIYPNPTDSDLRVTVSEIKEDENPTYAVYSIEGRVVEEEQRLHTETVLDFSGYTDGVYILVLRMKDEQIVRKIIKR